MLYDWLVFQLCSVFLSLGHSSEQLGCGHKPRTWEIQGKSEAERNVVASFRTLHCCSMISRTGHFVCYVLISKGRIIQIFLKICSTYLSLSKVREVSLLFFFSVI